MLCSVALLLLQKPRALLSSAPKAFILLSLAKALGKAVHLEARRVFPVGLKLGVQDSSFELFAKALVLSPEQSNIIDAKFHHGQTLKPEAKGPSFPALPTIYIKDLLLHNPIETAGCSNRGQSGLKHAVPC